MMCKMVKKGVVGLALAAGALYLAFGTSAPSYVRTAFHKMRKTAHQNVPVEFEIEKARQDVAALEPAIRQQIEVLANANVDIKYLGRDIADTRSNLETEGKALVALNDGLKSGHLQLTGGSTRYTPDEIRTDLARRWERYKQVQRTLKDKESILKSREEIAANAKRQLDEMAATKKSLLVKIEGIEARLSQLKATQAANEYTFDDTALSRAKQTVANLEKQLDRMAEVVDQEARFSDKGIPVAIEPSRDVSREIDAEFGTTTKTDKSL